MVAPDDHLFDVGNSLAGAGGQLRQGAVVIQTQHGGEVFTRQVRRGIHGDERVGVGRVADHQYLDITGGHVVQGAALDGEDGTVGFEQVLAFHALAARTRANQQRVVGVLEGNVRVIGLHHAGEQREGAVFEFHDHTLEGRQGRGDFQQLQDDRLVLAEHFAAGDTEQQAVTNLTGCAGDSNANWGFCHLKNSLRERVVNNEPGGTVQPSTIPWLPVDV